MTHTRQHIIIKALLCMSLALLSGCQLTSNNMNSRLTYGEYYLALHQFSPQQLIEEVEKQKINVNKKSLHANDYDAQIKLMLLHSLPKSPIYNSFHAKILLNQLKSEDNKAALTSITPNEQAFISLLHDQLNQRLLMRSRFIDQQEKLQKSALAQQQEAIKIQQNLTEQVKLLEQTIKQLQNIEKAIDKRDQ